MTPNNGIDPTFGGSSLTFGISRKMGGTMEVSVFIKDESGKPFLMEVDRFTESQWNILRTDWLSYTTSGKPKGGSYDCSDYEGRPKQVLLNFSKIAGISNAENA